MNYQNFQKYLKLIDLIKELDIEKELNLENACREELLYSIYKLYDKVEETTSNSNEVKKVESNDAPSNDYKNGYDNGYKDGYQDGHQDGSKDGYAKGYSDSCQDYHARKESCKNAAALNN